MSLLQAKVTLCASFWISRPALPGSIGRVASRQIPAISDRQKSTFFRAMQLKHGKHSDGSPRSVSKNWYALWSNRTWSWHVRTRLYWRRGTKSIPEVESMAKEVRL